MSQNGSNSSLAARSRKLRRGINLYPPYLGAGVRITRISDDFRDVEVEMPLRFYNRNYFGTHFGGSLYSMCDPFYEARERLDEGIISSDGREDRGNPRRSRLAAKSRAAVSDSDQRYRGHGHR
jgi:hypothetical protein